MQTALSQDRYAGNPLSVIVIGATGDLAKRKIFPALFALFSQELLPERFQVFGFARHPMTDEVFRNHITEHLTCRYVPGESCARYMDEFLSRCHYVSGEYKSVDSFLELYQTMRLCEGDGEANRVYYMAIPPFLFMDVGHSLANSGLVSCDEVNSFSRVVIEKPFGRDRESSDELVTSMRQVFSEDQTYRIDHYLGKEIVQNLIVLRFANTLFDPLWNHTHIEQVKITWKEEIGVEDRGGYFDSYGIVRDVVQNHLTQLVALMAMDPPAALNAHSIRNEKVKVLSSIEPVTCDDLVVGQYTAGEIKGVKHGGYLEESGVAPGSLTPTFASVILRVRNSRWDGVPFLITAGKGVNERLTEIRVRFRPVPGKIFNALAPDLGPNELVIRVQPDEAIYLRINNKMPGLEMKLVETELNLRYESAFATKIPDAYECLLLDVFRGDRSLFIRFDELAAAWDIFNPVLHQMERDGVVPAPYTFGSEGPAEGLSLQERHRSY